MSKNNGQNSDLSRSTTDKWLLGVCGGIAEYLGWKNANILRILVIIAFIFLFKIWYLFVLVYFALGLILSENK